MEIKVYEYKGIVFLNHNKDYNCAPFGGVGDHHICDSVGFYVDRTKNRRSLFRQRIPQNAKLILTIKLKGDKK